MGLDRSWETCVPLRDRYDDDDDDIPSDQKYLRNGVRVNSRVKISVRRQDPAAPRLALGQTTDISARGCRVMVPETYEVGETLVLTNLNNQQECDATVIWCGPHQHALGWEMGLQLKEAGQDFWELEF